MCRHGLVQAAAHSALLQGTSGVPHAEDDGRAGRQGVGRGSQWSAVLLARRTIVSWRHHVLFGPLVVLAFGEFRSRQQGGCL